jgi:nucleotide-binding universal stress UspA family protein
MKPFRKILVPTDFSSHSAEAVRYAADLSRRYEASVTVAHAFQPAEYAFPEGYLLHKASDQAGTISRIEQELAAAKAEARAAGALDVETTMLEGVASAAIVGFAEKGGHDLIVMGTHGRTGFKHALLGSVAEKVVRTAPCAVLTVRAGART